LSLNFKNLVEEKWETWLKMWNENERHAFDVVSHKFKLHMPDVNATINPEDITSPETLAAWVRDFRSKFDGLKYRTEFGPLIDEEGGIAAFRWIGTAKWLGKTGWNLDTPGDPVTFVGVDIFKFEGDEVVEVWTQGAVTLTT